MVFTWYEREEDALCEQLNNGEISQAEYYAAMRDLADQLRAEAQRAAEDAYNDVMGGW
jgi:hypothetical protein